MVKENNNKSKNQHTDDFLTTLIAFANASRKQIVYYANRMRTNQTLNSIVRNTKTIGEKESAFFSGLIKAIEDKNPLSGAVYAGSGYVANKVLSGIVTAKVVGGKIAFLKIGAIEFTAVTVYGEELYGFYEAYKNRNNPHWEPGTFLYKNAPVDLLRAWNYFVKTDKAKFKQYQAAKREQENLRRYTNLKQAEATNKKILQPLQDQMKRFLNGLKTPNLPTSTPAFHAKVKKVANAYNSKTSNLASVGKALIKPVPPIPPIPPPPPPVVITQQVVYTDPYVNVGYHSQDYGYSRSNENSLMLQQQSQILQTNYQMQLDHNSKRSAEQAKLLADVQKTNDEASYIDMSGEILFESYSPGLNHINSDNWFDLASRVSDPDFSSYLSTFYADAHEKEVLLSHPSNMISSEDQAAGAFQLHASYDDYNGEVGDFSGNGGSA